MTKQIVPAVGFALLSAAVLTGATVQRWIHVRVQSARALNSAVTINVPITMAEAVLPALPSDRPHHGKFNVQASVNGADLRAVLDAAGNASDNTSINLQRQDKEITIAKSGPDLLIKIVEPPSDERHLGKTVAIKIPIAVLRAMATGNSDQVDIAAGLRALARQGEMDVTLNNENETVRVWTDTRTESE